VGLFQKNELVELLERLTKWLLAIRAAYASGRKDEALDEIRKARALLAGSLGSSIERVDASTVVALLGAERARMYAELARVEAEVRLSMGDEAGARAASARCDAVERATK
jgi:hypothetical protein